MDDIKQTALMGDKRKRGMGKMEKKQLAGSGSSSGCSLAAVPLNRYIVSCSRECVCADGRECGRATPKNFDGRTVVILLCHTKSKSTMNVSRLLARSECSIVDALFANFCRYLSILSPI